MQNNRCGIKFSPYTESCIGEFDSSTYEYYIWKILFDLPHWTHSHSLQNQLFYAQCEAKGKCHNNFIVVPQNLNGWSWVIRNNANTHWWILKRCFQYFHLYIFLLSPITNTPLILAIRHLKGKTINRFINKLVKLMCVISPYLVWLYWMSIRFKVIRLILYFINFTKMFLIYIVHCMHLNILYQLQL